MFSPRWIRPLSMVVCVLLADGGILAWGQAPAADRSKGPAPPENQREIRLRTVDAENQPLAGVSVHFAVMYRDESGADKLKQDTLTTDKSGELVIGLPGASPELRLWAWKTGHATVFCKWKTDESGFRSESIPGEFTLRLLPVVTASGRIVDEEGNPIPGVQVEVKLASEEIDFAVAAPQRYSGHLAWGEAIRGEAVVRMKRGNLVTGQVTDAFKRST